MNCIPLESLAETAEENVGGFCSPDPMEMSSPSSSSGVSSPTTSSGGGGRQRPQQQQPSPLPLQPPPPAPTSKGRLRVALSSVVSSIKSALVLPNLLNNNCAVGGRSVRQAHSQLVSEGGGGGAGSKAIVRSQSGNINRRQYNKLRTLDDDEEEESVSGLRPPRPSASFPATLSSAVAARAVDLRSPSFVVEAMEEDDDDEAEDYCGEIWDDEELTCNVCERAFSTPRLLERHRQKRRHWGCTTCDSLFDSVIELEYHKDQWEHWTDSDLDDEDDEILGYEEWLARDCEDRDMADLIETAANPDLGVVLGQVLDGDPEQVRRFRRLRRRLARGGAGALGEEEEDEEDGGGEVEGTMLLQETRFGAGHVCPADVVASAGALEAGADEEEEAGDRTMLL